MKLYDGGFAPNPRRVRIFLAEKGVSFDTVSIDMGAFGHRSELLSSLNPLQRLPVLELDDGAVVTESVAICRYIEETHPEPPLFGTGALGKARVEEWNRRAELNLLMAVAHAFRHIHPAMVEWEVPQIPEWGEANKPRAVATLRLMDERLASSPFLAGDAFSIADITAMVAVDFMKPARIAVPPELVNLQRWRETVSSRPSAKA